MYKCTECNAEFNIKPDYCDCGNDTFEQIAADTPVVSKPDKKEIFKKEILSVAVFVLCLILSLLVWLFLGNTSPQKQENNEPKAAKAVKSTAPMPDINTLWDDALPSQIQKREEPRPVKKKIEELTQPPVQKPSQPAKSAAQSKKAAQKPANTQPRVQKPKTKVQPAPKKPKSDNQELISYKTALRQALFSHLAVTSVHGKGRCTVEFGIARNGKLVGRKFVTQSQNTTVNDAVYNMLMSIPQYYPPPDSYKGEKIRMSFYFDDGYYEINYLN